MKRYLIMIIATVAVIPIIVALVNNFKKIRIDERVSFKSHLYENYLKRGFDIFCSLMAIFCFGWLYIIVAVLVKNKLGSPVIFKQPRPGKDGKIFNMYKFRTMTDEKDEEGNLLPDEVRLTSFGKKLRSTSLDELPEAFNILKGDMSIIGPRPQLVRDMVFMTEEQKKRHTVRPGLSGFAQIKGRNDIDWEDKLNWDLEYIENITFLGDLRIIFETVIKAFVKQEGITDGDMATAEDYGDYLLHNRKVSQEEYDKKQEEAKNILNGEENLIIGKIEDKYSVLMSLYIKENADYFRTAIYSMINQTIKPDEIILVEDGPLTDELYFIIEEIKIKFPNLITSVVHEKNYGLGIALQHGVEVSRNEIIARMDTDDIAKSDRCEKQLNFLNEHLDVSIVGGQIEEFIGEISNVVGKRTVPLTNLDLKKYVQKRCPFNHMTVMFRKSQIINVGNYKDWFWNEDYYLWIRLAIANTKFANLPETLVMVRTGEDMYQRRGGIKYFISERNIQKFMLENNIISHIRYLINVSERFVLQILLPNRLRGFVFRTFARK